MRRTPAGHPHHDARVALPHAHLAGARDPDRRRGRDRRRDPRGRRDEARLAPGADARAPQRAAGGRPRRRSASASARRRTRSRRSARFLVGPAPAGAGRRRRDPQAAGPADPRPGRVDGRARAEHRRPRPARSARRRRVDAQVDLAGDLPRDAAARPRAPLDDRLRQQPPRRRAPGAAPQRAGQRTRGRGTSRPRPPRLARARGAHGRRGAAQGGRAAVPGRDLVARARHRHGRRRPRRSRSSRRSPSPAACSASAAPATTSATRRKGRIFPKFRADLLECAVVARLMREGRIEPTVVPRNALDVLAQQIVAIAAPRRRTSAVGGRRPARAGHAHALLRRAAAPAAGERARHARRPLPVAGVRRAAPAHRLGPRRRHDPRAQGRARSSRSPTRARSPTAASSRVVLPDGRRVGELDEEMVYEARAGPDVPARRVVLAHRGDRPRPRRSSRPPPGVPGAVPVLARRQRRAARRSSGERSARSRAGPSTRPPRRSSATTTSTRSPPATSSTTCASSRTATRVIPSDRTIVVERFRDEIGDWRLCVLRPTAAASTPRGRWRSARASATSSAWSPTRSGRTTGSSSTCPTPTSRRAPTSCCSTPTRSRTWSSRELGASALFGARFRENAGRALLIPRAYPGRRTPLWQQRLKAQSLLEVAKRYADFPIILETYRECLRDVLDVPGLHRAAHARCTGASCRSSRSRRRRPRRSPRRCCSTTSRRTCTRATRRTPSGARRPSRSTATCCASCSARRSCAS